MSASSSDVIPITTKAAYMAVRVELRDADLMNATCVICKGPVCDLCITCKQSIGADPAACQLARGECGHVNHVHCLEEWVRVHHRCPTCTAEWRQAGPDFSP